MALVTNATIPQNVALVNSGVKGVKMNIGITGIPVYQEENITSIRTSTILFCPYCGKQNYIAPYWTDGNTIGVILCIQCGRELM